jgi:predicted Zn-dependent peptidase
MAKLRRRAQAHFLLGLQSNLSRAQQLGAEELYSGDANRLNTKLDRKLAVTPDDMRRVVGKYLTRARQSTVEVKPARAAGGKK